VKPPFSLVLFLLLLLPLPAGAATLEIQTPIPLVPAVVGGGCGYPTSCEHDVIWDAGDPLEVPRFDPALGNLQSVELALAFEAETTTWLTDREGSTPGPTLVTLSIELSRWDAGGLQVSALDTQVQDPCPAYCAQGWSLAASGGEVFTGDLSAWIGLAPILYDWRERLDVDATYQLDDVATPVDPTATLTTIYTYVPEPSTALLMGIGLALARVRGGRNRDARAWVAPRWRL
jgi:hypothetical protein